MKHSEVKNSKTKLILFAVTSFIVLLIASFWSIIWPVVGQILMPAQYQKDLNRGIATLPKDRKQGEEMVERAVADAISKGAPIEDRLSMLKQYALALYDLGDWKQGDAQTQRLLDMAPKDLPWSDGDLVACAYQERAAHAYWRYLDDKKGSAGDKDQETALAICEKSYGPDNVATVYKVVLLSLIYRAMGQNDKAHLMMQRALTAVDTKPDAKGAAWYVYDYNAQLLALEHNYSAAIKSYLQAKGFCGGDSDRDRVWADFCAALRRSQPEEDKLSEPVESWLDQGKFSDLDRLSDRLNKEQTSYPIGSTPSGNMYNTLATCSTEEEYRKRFGRLSEWLKQNPRSMAAGLCLSKCYAEYAWFARGKGWADSVTERGWKLFEARLAQAKEVLDADPGITKKSPYAYFVYSKVALGQSWDKDKYMKLVHECHTLWPKYMGIDFATTWFLTPRWGGEAGESERYIESRANEIGGTKGDVAYARIVWWSQNYLDDLFSAKSPIEWSRVASGFKQLFTEYPHSLETRIGYMELARKAGHNEEFQTALNGFEPSSGSPGTPVSASNPQPASK